MVLIHKEKCINCGLCAKECTGMELVAQNGKMQFVDNGRCIYCGHCVAVCPQNAISFDEPGYSENEFVAATLQDAAIDSNILMKAIQSRRSIRHYKTDKIKRAEIESLIEAARFSPTSSNSQALSYIIIQDDLEQIRAEAIKSLYDMAKEWEVSGTPAGMERYQPRWIDMYNAYLKDPSKDYLFFHAPAVCVIVAPSTPTPMQAINVGIAASNMELMAFSKGLGLCYCGFLIWAINNSETLRKRFQISDDRQAYISFMFGYPDTHFIKSVSRKKPDVQYH